ncbi:MAG: hypothetical protein A2275_03590 [Bacteroidetes bacterium RIFOXYA12_FULL_35_11]|nr:MAG: hypothetical protein A2X01_05450 [Bacteroidetes bacterium GWF2_35_48]OFY81952.1 MAG: hypothetical protein A2275_03590 [Bacteroidetes bacterium RIFOXYA12_FULL_35_11]HBX52200.1 hypothetical protein [Bacteroidales bacterium]
MRTCLISFKTQALYVTALFLLFDSGCKNLIAKNCLGLQIRARVVQYGTNPKQRGLVKKE